MHIRLAKQEARAVLAALEEKITAHTVNTSVNCSIDEIAATHCAKSKIEKGLMENMAVDDAKPVCVPGTVEKLQPFADGFPANWYQQQQRMEVLKLVRAHGGAMDGAAVAAEAEQLMQFVTNGASGNAGESVPNEKVQGDTTGISRLYQKAEWRHTTPVNAAAQEIGFSFTMDGKAQYFRMGLDSATHLAETLGEFLASCRAAESGVAELKQVPSVDANIYCGENYPREGCTITINFGSDKWFWQINAPKEVGGGVVESVAHPHGSLGMALDYWFGVGTDIRPCLPKMREAEAAYASSSGSTVTR